MSPILIVFASLAVLCVLGYLSVTLRSRVELIGGWLLDKQFTAYNTLHDAYSVGEHQFHRQLKKNKVIKGGGREIWVVQDGEKHLIPDWDTYTNLGKTFRLSHHSHPLLL